MRKLVIRLMWLFPLTLVILGAMLFIPAGTLGYWQAWIFLPVLFVPFLFTAIYFMNKDPGLMKRRMKFKEKEVKQKKIIKISSIFFLLGFLVPGLDYRYGWSHVPVWLVITANALVFLGYVIIFFVFKENSYTSRTVEVYKEQKLVSGGPYAIVRHPMYAGFLLMFIALPLALGSYYALIIFIPVMIGTIIPRLLNEEDVLKRDLKGYKEYMKKVRYRLIPGIW
jgi:protein-S-isoprenylcysteine O-methyltransferase Ste14